MRGHRDRNRPTTNPGLPIHFINHTISGSTNNTVSKPKSGKTKSKKSKTAHPSCQVDARKPSIGPETGQETEQPVLPSAPHSPVHPALGQATPEEAYRLSQDENTVFIDIRSEIEHFFIGNPPGVINIPWQDAPDFELNPNFLEEVSRTAHKDQPVLLICRSGHRSIDAGNFLLENGFQRVYNVLEGFEGDRDEHHHRSSVNGWRFRGLPWVQC